MNGIAVARPRGFVAELRLDRRELSGAFGDSSVLFPLAASLVAVNGLDPTAVFTGAGLFYVGAALYFRLPMPVQPLKAFSAIAIASALSPSVIAAGALILGTTYLLLGATGLIGVVARAVPLPVVKGIQLWLGIALLRSAWEMAQRPQGLVAPTAVSALGVAVPIGVPLAAAALAVVLVLLRWRFAPASVVVLAGGAAAGAVWGIGVGPLALGPTAPALVVPGPGDWWPALTLLAIPQLPLSVGNAMISTHDAARTYFGRGAERATLGAIATSMGIANLAAGLFAGIPMCHGAGGLTAHYRFGARTAAATLAMGATLIVLGVVFGRSALELVTRGMPPAILGALLAYVGWEHLQLVRALRGPGAWTTCVAVAVIGTVVADLAVGVLAGITGWYLVRWARSVHHARGVAARRR